MTTVLLSFATADAPQARRVKERLTALGYTVEEARLTGSLKGAAKGPHILLWSRAASRAAPLRTSPPPILIAQLDASDPPRVRGAARVNLQHWSGRDDHRGWRRLADTLARGAGAAARPAEPPAVAASAMLRNPGAWRGWLFGLALIGGCAAWAYTLIAG
jgi:hypothetical protein